ncbi:AMP-binding protein [Hymenobacter lucidus]|uniref:AMP-binding protein n=1 Tax=Hymenobacter lucidus TaxID=2880930 RepID=A0ABS8ARS5_9BACT|nr:AMP-binding protein [Hymenobacter lucidus]MCB2407702.1 AMP-binding protein [Hymenobacter lucidus]
MKLEWNIINCLATHSIDFPDKPAFVFLEDGEGQERVVSFSQLFTRVQQLGSDLLNRHPQGKRALLVYQDAVEFTVSFLACQYAGVTAVPVFLAKGSKQLARFTNLMQDAQASAILTGAQLEAQIRQGLPEFINAQAIVLITTDSVVASTIQPPVPAGEAGAVAFLQYTSGSTGKPKGVVVTSANLMHNQLLIKNTFGCDEQSVIFSWLPFHHDMGLIGNILHTIYVGCTCVLMSPYHFIQMPLRWLKGIAKYKATHSGGPNFAYDHCVSKIPPEEIARLDLSSWKVAYNGAEPVRVDTIQRFCSTFAAAGFSSAAFYPCYGLAEATLLVAGSKATQEPEPLFIKKEKNGILLADKNDLSAKAVVSSGQVAEGMALRVLALNTGRECGELEEGEICIAGDSVSSGYWAKNNAEYFVDVQGQRFLRTGDLGFLYQGQLYVHGRLKEMLIFRGENLYPYDIEQSVAQSHPALENNGVSVFAYSPAAGAEDEVVIVAEVRRTSMPGLDGAAVIAAIEKAVSGTFGIQAYDIVLTTVLGIPRTTSGKLQRVRCQDIYRQQGFQVLESKRGLAKSRVEQEPDMVLRQAVLENGNYATIKSYLLDLIAAKTGTPQVTSSGDDLELTEMGIDSVRAMELLNTISRDLSINMDASKVFQDNTLLGLVTAIESMLWLKSGQNSGKSLII